MMDSEALLLREDRAGVATLTFNRPAQFNAQSTELLDAEVARLAATICAKSQTAITMGKRLFYRQLETGLAGAYQLASETMACNMMTDDAVAGIDGFMNKKKG